MELQKKTKSKKPSNALQFEVLLTEIQKLPFLGEDYPTDTEKRLKIEKAWVLISNKLNEIGPPYRKPREWRKVWTDLRGRTKRKIEVACLPDSQDVEFCLNNLTSIEKEVDRIYQYSQRSDPSSDQISYSANDIKIEPAEEDELRELTADEECTSHQSSVEYPTSLTAVPNLSTHSMGTLVPQLSANLTNKRLRRKRRCVEMRRDLLKQQFENQKNLLKYSIEQNNISEQQIDIFSKISQSMARQVAAVEKQTNAVEGFLKILKERIL